MVPILPETVTCCVGESTWYHGRPSISACGGMWPDAIHCTRRAASIRPYPLVGSNPGPVGSRWVVTNGRSVLTFVLFAGPLGGAAVAKSMSSADMVTSCVISLADSATGAPETVLQARGRA